MQLAMIHANEFITSRWFQRENRLILFGEEGIGDSLPSPQNDSAENEPTPHVSQNLKRMREWLKSQEIPAGLTVKYKQNLHSGQYEVYQDYHQLIVMSERSVNSITRDAFIHDILDILKRNDRPQWLALYYKMLDQLRLRQIETELDDESTDSSSAQEGGPVASRN